MIDHRPKRIITRDLSHLFPTIRNRFRPEEVDRFLVFTAKSCVTQACSAKIKPSGLVVTRNCRWHVLDLLHSCIRIRQPPDVVGPGGRCHSDRHSPAASATVSDRPLGCDAVSARRHQKTVPSNQAGTIVTAADPNPDYPFGGPRTLQADRRNARRVHPNRRATPSNHCDRCDTQHGLYPQRQYAIRTSQTTRSADRQLRQAWGCNQPGADQRFTAAGDHPPPLLSDSGGARRNRSTHPAGRAGRCVIGSERGRRPAGVGHGSDPKRSLFHYRSAAGDLGSRGDCRDRSNPARAEKGFGTSQNRLAGCR